MSRDAHSHSWIFDRKRLYLHSHSAPAPADLPDARLSLVRSDGATLGFNHEPKVWGGWGFHHAKQRIPAGPELPSRLPNVPPPNKSQKQNRKWLACFPGTDRLLFTDCLQPDSQSHRSGIRLGWIPPKTCCSGRWQHFIYRNCEN